MNVSEPVLAIDAGGTMFKSALVAGGGIVDSTWRSVPVDSSGPAESVLAAYRDMVRHALADAAGLGGGLAGVCVSTPGPFDYAAGCSRMLHKFRSLYGVDLRKAMRDGTGLPADTPIRFIHDANAFVMGEYRYGAAKGFASVAGITLGTGIGCGWIVGNQLRPNDSGGPLESVYRLACRGGVLEDFASGRGLIALYRRHSGTDDPSLTARGIADLARNSDGAQALAAFAEMGTCLGETIAPLLVRHGIQCLVFGGQISRAFDLFGDSVSAALGLQAGGIAVRQALHIDTAALMGCPTNTTTLRMGR